MILSKESALTNEAISFLMKQNLMKVDFPDAWIFHFLICSHIFKSERDVVISYDKKKKFDILF